MWIDDETLAVAHRKAAGRLAAKEDGVRRVRQCRRLQDVSFPGQFEMLSRKPGLPRHAPARLVAPQNYGFTSPQNSP